eukprot:1712967-Heterocapsa_arctica.AAC.1
MGLRVAQSRVHSILIPPRVVAYPLFKAYVIAELVNLGDYHEYYEPSHNYFRLCISAYNL